jgi:predicted nucleotidyltransferase
MSVPARQDMPQRIMIERIVGSTAYGMAGPASDQDRLDVFVESTDTLLGLDGLHEKRRSWVGPKVHGDRALHEVGKFCQKALGCNPTLLELLWLPDHLYLTRTPQGNQLIRSRELFLSARQVRDSYLGYALGQLSEVKRDHRASKQARHMARLLHQGFELWSTGVLRVEMENPQWFLDFGEDVAGGNTDRAIRLMASFEDMFNKTKTVLPEQPNREDVNAWLKWLRRQHL